MRQFLVFFILVVIGVLPAEAQRKSEQDYQKEYEKRLTKEYIDRVYIPKDLEDAFNELDKKMETEAKVGLMALEEAEAPRKYHFVLGRWLIKNWSLDRGSRLSQHLREKGIYRADDMAKFILLTYYRRLHNKPIQEEALLAQLTAKYAEEKAKRAQFRTVIHQETRIRNQ